MILRPNGLTSLATSVRWPPSAGGSFISPGTFFTSERNATWLDVEAPPPPRPAEGVPREAATMIRWVQDAHGWWSDIIEGCDDEHLLSPIGSIAGRSDGPRAGFAAYTNMELIHHGAEVGLLRDLWAARG